MQTQDPADIGGEVERIAFRNDENGYTVFKMRHDRLGTVTVTGTFPHLHEGEYVELAGQWTNHKQYGKQFKSSRRLPYETPESIQRYLSSPFVRGIGEKTAEKIVAHFGIDSLRVLDDEPYRLEEIPSIGKKKRETIMAAWGENKLRRDTEFFLVSHGMSPGLALRVMQKYQNETIALLKENPYRLAADIPRVGFLTADRIAQAMGVPMDSPQRITAAILHRLKEAEDQGHLFLTTEQLVTELMQNLGVSLEVLTKTLAPCLKELNAQGSVVSNEIREQDGHITKAHYQTELLLAELNCARKLLALSADTPTVDEARIDSWLERYMEATKSPLSDDQRAAVKKAAFSYVYVLTGGPGVGKTTTANAIIRLFKAMNLGVALCAPTGRAAQRLTEISGLPAATIHRLLEWSPQSGGFQRASHNPLAAQVVVVDEASMLDVRLAEALLEAVAERARIIFIGDVDQLPSVGPGNFLRDIIASGRVPFTRLTQIFRQAATSRIVRTAHTINAGEVPTFEDVAESDCRFVEADTPQAVRGTIKELVSEILPRRGYDPVRDIQILTPMNRGELGTQALNEELQRVLNPGQRQEATYERQGLVLRSGDKVIQNSNNYELNVFNGDIGIVQHCGVEGGKLIVRFGDRDVAYDAEGALDLRLAYAITIHKSQGSEFPVVILPLTMQHYVMLQRNLVYTGLTRGRRLAIFVGTRQALEQAVRQTPSEERQTRLIELLNREERACEDSWLD